MRKKLVHPASNKQSVDVNATSRGRTERDLDEQVHSEEMEKDGSQNAEDPDDRVHKPAKRKPEALNAEDNPKDPDDLVHENGDDEDDD